MDKKAKDSLLAEYRQKEAVLWAEYRQKIDPLWAEYVRKVENGKES